MKINILATSLLLSLGLSVASVSASQPDPRFYGIWDGAETYQMAPYVDRYWHQSGEAPVTKSAIIVIGDSGQTLAFGEGLLQGRAEISPSWGQNTLNFRVRSSASQRTFGKLVLSADGNTLTETAFARVPSGPIVRTCDISGTFHRQGKVLTSSQLVAPQPDVVLNEEGRRLMLTAPQPEYPTEALAKDIQGNGIYNVSISVKTGVVSRVDILRSTGSKLLDDAAVKSLLGWRARPNTVSHIRVPIRFCVCCR
jgi:TonB family protein